MLDRRKFLQVTGAGAAMLALGACDGAAQSQDAEPQADEPEEQPAAPFLLPSSYIAKVICIINDLKFPPV